MDLFDDLPEPTISQTSENTALDFDISQRCEKPSVETGEPENGTGVTSNIGLVVEKRKLEDIDQEMSKQDYCKIKPSVKYKLKSYIAERQGERDEMQDAHVIFENYTQEFKDLDPSIHRIAIYGVYDGHGGTRASRFASENLHKILRDKFPKGNVDAVEKEIKKIIVETFKKTDEEFLKEATKSKPVWKDGTTATVVMVINDTLFVASLGDSQAFLCRKKEELSKCVPIHLTTVHDPCLYDERRRIQKAGGSVKDGRVMGVLEVSRSIGDGQYKKHGVSCIPDVKKCQITSEDRYVVLACDGLWKKFSPDECLKVINNILEDEGIEGTDNKSSEDVRYETACSSLANQAVLRLSADNVTVLLISIKEH